VFLRRSDETSEPVTTLTKINRLVNTPPPACNPQPAKAPRHISNLPDTFQWGFLGKSASLAAQLLAQLGWHNFIKLLQHPTSLSPDLHSLAHPAAPYLSRIARHGVPLLASTPPWDPTLKTTAFRRGPHPSASRQYADFLQLDMYDYVRMGFWVILPFSAISSHPYLKLAPAGVVPQRDRRPRPIMDYTYNNVNQTSLPIAPFSSMQFGSALQHILQRLAYSPLHPTPPYNLPLSYPPTIPKNPLLVYLSRSQWAGHTARHSSVHSRKPPRTSSTTHSATHTVCCPIILCCHLQTPHSHNPYSSITQLRSRGRPALLWHPYSMQTSTLMS
jgi:hypothetical protein